MVIQLTDLIFSQRFGQRSFNLDVPERTACMDALFNGAPVDENGQPESVANIVRRFHDIEELFPEELAGRNLPYFADWLIENVHLVEITAYSDSDAYTIFETMNDRGLSLTPTDMLKGYLLANITNADLRERASNVWRGHVSRLKEVAKEEDADAIKAWLRSQHAQSIRERRRGAQPRDFDLIGTEFHRWVRDHAEILGLCEPADFARFIEEDFAFYAGWYSRIRAAAQTLTPGLEAVFYNSQNEFTLQYPVLLAPLQRGDPEEDVLRKIQIAAGYLDIVIARRIWNFKSTAYSTMQYGMFVIIREIRRKPVRELAELLHARLQSEEDTFAANDRFALHGMNGKQIHRLLARMTDFVETRSGRASRYAEYINRSGRNSYDIEHIWANRPEEHRAGQTQRPGARHSLVAAQGPRHRRGGGPLGRDRPAATRHSRPPRPDGPGQPDAAPPGYRDRAGLPNRPVPRCLAPARRPQPAQTPGLAAGTVRVYPGAPADPQSG